jgi:hypothetical protein
VITNSVGITSVVRTARIAAGTDHAGSQLVGPGLGVQGRLRRDNEKARASLDTSGECKPPQLIRGLGVQADMRRSAAPVLAGCDQALIERFDAKRSALHGLTGRGST